MTHVFVFIINDSWQLHLLPSCLSMNVHPFDTNFGPFFDQMNWIYSISRQKRLGQGQGTKREGIAVCHEDTLSVYKRLLDQTVSGRSTFVQVQVSDGGVDFDRKMLQLHSMYGHLKLLEDDQPQWTTSYEIVALTKIGRTCYQFHSRKNWKTWTEAMQRGHDDRDGVLLHEEGEEAEEDSLPTCQSTLGVEQVPSSQSDWILGRKI